MLLRLDPHVYNALARWASEEFRSTNGQIAFLLGRRSLMQIVFAPPKGQGGRAELLGGQARADLHIGKALNCRGCADFRRALCPRLNSRSIPRTAWTAP